jgi:hypothetical protein
MGASASGVSDRVRNLAKVRASPWRASPHLGLVLFFRTAEDECHSMDVAKGGYPYLGNTEEGGLAPTGANTQWLALTFAKPRPPVITPLVLAALVRTAKQYGQTKVITSVVNAEGLGLAKIRSSPRMASQPRG